MFIVDTGEVEVNMLPLFLMKAKVDVRRTLGSLTARNSTPVPQDNKKEVGSIQEVLPQESEGINCLDIYKSRSFQSFTYSVLDKWYIKLGRYHLWSLIHAHEGLFL